MSDTAKIVVFYPEDISDDGFVEVWEIKDKSKNERWRSVKPIWDILSAQQLFELCCSQLNTIEIPKGSLSKNFEKII